MQFSKNAIAFLDSMISSGMPTEPVHRYTVTLSGLGGGCGSIAHQNLYQALQLKVDKPFT